MAKIEWKEAQKSVLNESGNMLVSASAGTGKTTVMLEKVLRLVESGHNIDRLLIITFSNASAAEMKEKLIKKLYEKLRDNTGNKKNLKKQLDLIDFSNISTIDSFFFNIFKMFYALIGYDPAFEVADEKEAHLLFSETIDEVIEEYLHKKDDDFFALLERFVKSRDISPLKKAVKDIFTFMNKQKDPKEFEMKAMESLSLAPEKNPAILFYVSYHKKTLRKCKAELENLLIEIQDTYPNLYGTYKDYIKEIINTLYYIYNKENFYDFVKAVKETDPSRKPRSPKDLMGEEERIDDNIALIIGYAKSYLKSLREEFGQYIIDNSHLKDSVKDVKKLLEIVLSVKEKYQYNKQKRKKLDFADLSLLALKILNIESCQNKIKDMFDFIFVDEYQDTNYIQEEIIKLCSKGDNLFMVGDPKQSIYQFRDAEPRIFLNRYDIYENHKGEGKNKNLNDNFRSDKRILDFVNMVFSEIMNPDFGGVDYKKNALLVAAQPFPQVSDIPPVEIFEYQKPKDQPPIKDVYSVKEDQVYYQSDIQSTYIAEKISQLAGKEFIYDKDQKQKRIIEYKDIAILMYQRDDKVIKELQKRQIPFSASGFNKDKIYEIELMVDFLRLINNIADDIVLSSVMLSPLYSFTPKELLEIRKSSDKEMFWESLIQYKGIQTIELKIQALLDDLDRYGKMSAYTSVYELMLAILSEGFDACLLQKGEEIVEQINNFINSVKGREFTKSITSFLEYYDNSVQEGYEASSVGNSVKITTIHKSKGLEFPVVFVADAHKGFNSKHNNDKDLFTDTDFGIAMKYFDTIDRTKSHTLLTKSFLLKSEYKEKEELMRLMYVAFTRAQNHLFISGEMEIKKQVLAEESASFMQWICFAKDKNQFVKDYFCQDDVLMETKEVVKKTDKIKSLSIDLNRLDFDYNHKSATKLPLKYSVTSLKDYLGGDDKDYTPKSSYLTSEQRIEKGVFYHKILELIDFKKNTKEQIKIQLEEFAEKGLLDKSVCENADLTVIENILTSDIISYAGKNKYYKEKPFMLYVPLNEITDSDCSDKVLVQGVIDLLILGEKNYIVDFKVTQSQGWEVINRYKKQLELYRIAAEELMNIKIDNCFVYLVNQNELLSL